jgi:uncharacterized protein YuzB (UPF0349 family)
VHEGTKAVFEILEKDQQLDYLALVEVLKVMEDSSSQVFAALDRIQLEKESQ